jgi:preprotein translocase subunit YajC
MTPEILYFLAQAATPAGQRQGTPADLLSPLVMFGCMAVIFYFLLIRPQKKKQQDHVKLVNSLKTGDKVVTSGGVHGLISNVKESTVMVKIADNVKIEVEKGSVERVVQRTDVS